MSAVYQIINKKNGFVYVGMTTRENPEIRWNEHIKSAQDGVDRRLYRGMRKHGIENFDFQVIATFNDLKDKDIIFKVEKQYIKEKNSYWFGYNDTVGGKGFRFNRPKRGRKRTKKDEA